MARAVADDGGGSKITDIVVLHGGKEYAFHVHETEIGYWARCVELPEAITQARTLDELAENIKQVLTLALRPIPTTVKKKEN
ncbi:MAG: type II toxin-antitoxin system HicB family antitoxin [Thermoproteota archaeon]